MSKFECKRVMLLLPVGVLFALPIAFAVREAWAPSVICLLAAVAYFAGVWVWNRRREADEAIKRAAQHEADS